MKSTIPKSTFLTNQASESKRMEAYRESIGVVFDVENLPKNNFHARIDGYLISELMLVDCQTVEQRFLRPSSKIAQDNMDHFLIQLFLDGGTRFESKGTHNFCDSKKLVVIDASRPWKAYSPNFRNLTLVVPRRLLQSKLHDEDAHHGRILDPATNPFAEFLRSHILSLHRTCDRIEAQSAHSLINPSLDIVAMALNCSSYEQTGKYGDPDTLHTRTFLYQIKAFIEKNLSNSDLSTETIQKKFNLTRSTLYRLFPSSGGVMSYVRERRLKKAFKLLSVPNSSGTNITQVAHSLGFENQSSFTRTFKNHFGYLPSEVQKGQRCSLLSLEESPQRAWESWLLSL